MLLYYGHKLTASLYAFQATVLMCLCLCTSTDTPMERRSARTRRENGTNKLNVDVADWQYYKARRPRCCVRVRRARDHSVRFDNWLSTKRSLRCCGSREPQSHRRVRARCCGQVSRSNHTYTQTDARYWSGCTHRAVVLAPSRRARTKQSKL